MSSCGTGIFGVALHQSYLNTSLFYTSSHVFGSRDCLCAGPRGPSQRSAAFLREGACLLMIPSPVWSLFYNACLFLSCSLSLKVHVLRVHMHRRLLNTLPQEFLLCLRGNYVIIPCVIMPVMPVHTGLSREHPVGVLQSWNGSAGIQAGYCGSITYGNGTYGNQMLPCERSSNYLCCKHTNYFWFIKIEQWDVGPPWTGIRRGDALDARWERGDNYWRKDAFTKNKYLKCTLKFK